MKIGLCYGMWSSQQTLSLLYSKLIEAGYEVVWLRQDIDRRNTRTITDCIKLAYQRVIKHQVTMLAGHSMGGLICMKVVEQMLNTCNSGQIKKLLLFTPAAPRGIIPIDNLDQIMGILSSWFDLTKETFCPDIKTAGKVLYNQHSQLGLGWNYNDLKPDFSSLFKSILVPGVSVSSVRCLALIISGDSDKTVSPRISKSIYQKYFLSGSSELIIAEGHDHMSIVNHQEVVEQGINFLKGAP